MGGAAVVSSAAGGGYHWLRKCAEVARREPIAIHHQIQNSEIPPEFNGAKVFFISDFHFCRKKPFGQKLRTAASFENTLADIRDEISENDLLVLGGDFVAYPHFDAARDLPEVEEFLDEIKKFPQQKFALFGNHEWEYGAETVEQIGEFLTAAGCEVLRDESRIWKSGAAELPIFGTKDWRFGGMEIEKVQKFVAEHREQFKIIFTHNPDWVQNFLRKLELKNTEIQAGHTHGGQFSNWLISKLALAQAKYKSELISGRYKLRDEVDLIISNGAGASLPFRQEARRPDYLITELRRSEI